MNEKNQERTVTTATHQSSKMKKKQPTQWANVEWKWRRKTIKKTTVMRETNKKRRIWNENGGLNEKKYIINIESGQIL